MRTARTVIGTAAAATAMALTLGTAPAHATTLRGVYYSATECWRIGWYGYNNYGWGWPECLQQTPDGQPSTFWFLYS